LPNVAETEYLQEYTRTNKSGEKKYKWKVGFQAHGSRVMPHPQSVIFFTVIGMLAVACCRGKDTLGA